PGPGAFPARTPGARPGMPGARPGMPSTGRPGGGGFAPRPGGGGPGGPGGPGGGGGFAGRPGGGPRGGAARGGAAPGAFGRGGGGRPVRGRKSKKQRRQEFDNLAAPTMGGGVSRGNGEVVRLPR